MVRWISPKEFEAMTPEQKAAFKGGIDYQLDDDPDRDHRDLNRDVRRFGRNGWDGEGI